MNTFIDEDYELYYFQNDCKKTLEENIFTFNTHLAL